MDLKYITVPLLEGLSGFQTLQQDLFRGSSFAVDGDVYFRICPRIHFISCHHDNLIICKKTEEGIMMDRWFIVFLKFPGQEAINEQNLVINTNLIY